MNPAFGNADRAAYELPRLFKELKATSIFEPLSDEQRNVAAAIKVHAENAMELVLSGLESIGTLMTAVDSTSEIENYTFYDLGRLIKHLAIEANTLRETQSDMRIAIELDDKLRQSPDPAEAGRQRARDALNLNKPKKNAKEST